jgi:hypothetical protein
VWIVLGGIESSLKHRPCANRLFCRQTGSARLKVLAEKLAKLMHPIFEVKTTLWDLALSFARLLLHSPSSVD